MTKHADRKAAARSYAAEHGVSYSEARRALGYDENGTGAAGNAPVLHGPVAHTIGYAPHPMTGEPTPVRVDRFGDVLDQHIWRGRLYSLVGFNEFPRTTYAPTVDAGLWIFWGQKTWDPRGKYAVIAPVDRVYADPRLAPAPDWGLVVLPEPVGKVTVEPYTRSGEVEATVLSEEEGAPDLEFGLTFDVADWLLSLSDEEIRQARIDDWSSPVLDRFVIDEAHWQGAFTRRKGGALPTAIVLQAWAEHTDGLMEDNETHDWLERDAARRGELSAVQARMERDTTLAYPWKVSLDSVQTEKYLAQWGPEMTPDHMLLRYDPALPGGRPGKVGA